MLDWGEGFALLSLGVGLGWALRGYRFVTRQTIADDRRRTYEQARVMVRDAVKRGGGQ